MASNTGRNYQGRIRRWIYTPVSDLLRGRVTGSLDLPWKFRSVLPETLARHMLNCVPFGMSIRERFAAADELIAECRAALDAGTSPEQLIADRPHKATRRTILKRYRAKRGWFGRNGHHLAWLPLIFVGLYLLAVVYFFFSRPTLSVDYLAMLNEPALAVPEEDRAWPGYREVILKLDLPAGSMHGDHPSDEGYAPGLPRWPEVREWLMNHRDELDTLRTAAGKPGMGLTVGYSGHYTEDDALALWGPNPNDPTQPMRQDVERWDDLYNPMIEVLLPHLGMTRRLSRVLVADAYLAMEEGDNERFMASTMALNGLARHTAEIPTGMSGLVGVSIRTLAYHAITDALMNEAFMLNDSELNSLQSFLNNDTQDQLISFLGGRIEVLDMLQRTHTQGGFGGGHITPEGLMVVFRNSDLAESDRTDSAFINRLGSSIITPGMMLAFPTRTEVIEELNHFQQLAEQDHSIPMWEQSESSLLNTLSDRQSDAMMMRELLIDWNISYWWSTRKTLTQHAAIRDGLRIGIALEKYRREYGDWPESLDALAPTYLSQLPVDPITGGRLFYRVAKGKPMVYSVGKDRDDDDGRLPMTKRGYVSGELEPDPWAAASWDEQDPNDPIDGDWVLFPQYGTPLEMGHEATKWEQEQAEHEASERSFYQY